MKKNLHFLKYASIPLLSFLNDTATQLFTQNAPMRLAALQLKHTIHTAIYDALIVNGLLPITEKRQILQLVLRPYTSFYPIPNFYKN